MINLILSNKAAQKLQKKVDSTQESITDAETWRIDCLSLRKRSIFIITHGTTLYTFISSYKHGFNGIIEKIASTAQSNQFDINNIQYIKVQNKSIVGSMNNIKKLISQLDKYCNASNEQFEELVNNVPFKYLSYRTPAECYLAEE